MVDRNRRLLFASLAMAIAFVFGTLGYYLIGRGDWPLLECAYMTAITLTTVGYTESIPVHDLAGGQVFTILLVIAGVAVALYFVSTLMAFIIEGDLRELLGKRRMEKRLARVKDHVIVCGVGRTGRHAVAQLSHAGREVVLVDSSEANIQALMAERELDLAYVVGDATEEPVLRRTGIERAYGIICALDTDHANLYVVLSARSLNPKLRIVSKASDRSVGGKFMQVGADSVVSPT